MISLLICFLTSQATVDDAAAIKIITESGMYCNESDLEIDQQDPLSLRQGDIVSIYPTDNGFSHQDVGPLELLASTEVAVAKNTKDGVSIRVHYPRWQIKIERHAKNL